MAKKNRHINALTPLCPHLCLDPVTTLLRDDYMNAYHGLWTAVKAGGSRNGRATISE